MTWRNFFTRPVAVTRATLDRLPRYVLAAGETRHNVEDMERAVARAGETERAVLHQLGRTLNERRGEGVDLDDCRMLAPVIAAVLAPAVYRDADGQIIEEEAANKAFDKAYGLAVDLMQTLDAALRAHEADTLEHAA